MGNSKLKKAAEFLGGGGEMGALIRAHDWAATPLGRPAGWPQSAEDVDPHHALVALRHVDGLGRGAHFFLQRRLPADAWASSRAGRWARRRARSGTRSGRTSARASTRCSRTGEATWDEDLLLFLERSGYPGRDLSHLFLQPARATTADASPACFASSPKRPSASSASAA